MTAKQFKALKQFRSAGGIAKNAKMTPEERVAHAKKMVAAREAKRLANKSKSHAAI